MRHTELARQILIYMLTGCRLLSIVFFTRRGTKHPVYFRVAPEWRNGRRGGLKNRCLTTCEFDSRLGHHPHVKRTLNVRVRFLYIDLHISLSSFFLRAPLYGLPMMTEQTLGWYRAFVLLAPFSKTLASILLFHRTALF